MVAYLDKFCKDLAVITRPLRDILKQHVAWVWDDQQEKALCVLKSHHLSTSLETDIKAGGGVG